MARDLGLHRARGRGDPDAAGPPHGFDTSGTLAEAAGRAARLVERHKIAEALRAAEGNKTRAAEALGVGYKTLLTKIKDYEL